MEDISCPDLRQCIPLRFVTEACNHFLMPETIQVGSLVFLVIHSVELGKGGELLNALCITKPQVFAANYTTPALLPSYLLALLKFRLAIQWIRLSIYQVETAV